MSGDKVMFGATVKIVDEDTDKELTYRIVGPDESDIGKGLVSIGSPLARALIGKTVGDQVEVEAPGGSRSYEILSVSYAWPATAERPSPVAAGVTQRWPHNLEPRT